MQWSRALAYAVIATALLAPATIAAQEAELPTVVATALTRYEQSVAQARQRLSATVAQAQRQFHNHEAAARRHVLAIIEQEQLAAVRSNNQPLLTLLSAIHQRTSASATSSTRARRSLSDGTLSVRNGQPRNQALGWTATRATPLVTDQIIPAHAAVTITAATNDLNLRVQWLTDQVIFNWEVEPGTLLISGVFTGDHRLPEKGWIQPGVFHDFRFAVLDEHLVISVDGEERTRVPFPATHGLVDRYGRNLVVFTADSEITIKDIVVEEGLPR